MAKKILELCGDFTEDYETMVPFQALSMLGYEVDAVCPDKKAGDTVPTAVHDFLGEQTYTELRGHNFGINKDFDGVDTADYDGLFISNGPGDPAMCKETIAHIKDAFNDNKPICGICMGNQLLGAAAGASIYKLKYGHRSHNQPVREEGTNICHITSQNHGYALDTKGLGKDWAPLYTNLNDGTNEGVCHKTKPFFSSQFHPEAASGPTDTITVFDKFKALL